MQRIKIIDTDATNICDYGFCGFRNPELEGYRRKANWLKKRFAEGMKFKVLQVNGEDAGMIEYTPGESTWRPVKAAGYMVIHCIMINKKKYKGKGYGALLVEESVKDAKKAKMDGVVVVTSDGTWMAGKDLFIRCGFESVDTAPPSFALMVRKLRKAPSPRFEAGRDRSLRKYASGLTIIKSDQCPCIAKCTNDILQVCRELQIHPRIVELTNGSQARNAPSAYGIFNIVYNGDLVADHPISGTRFKNIVKKIAK
jgi:N-acetylglutamate synthase-like GNAT family acetyltransferase